MSAEKLDSISDAVRDALDAHATLLASLDHHPHLSFMPKLDEWPAVLAAAVVWARRREMRLVEKDRDPELRGIHVIEIRDTKPGERTRTRSDGTTARMHEERNMLIATIHVPDELVGTDALGTSP